MFIKNLRFVLISSIVSLSSFVNYANATTITLDAIAGGWYTSDGANNGTQSNVFTGKDIHRNWFAWDISAV